MNSKARPIEKEWFTLTNKIENEVESITDQEWPKLGKKTPELLPKLGTTLSLLGGISSCHWGCSTTTKHVLERIVGRVVTTSHASLRLLKFGYYDEAINLTRSIVEIGNLFFLFFSNEASFTEWLKADTQARKSSWGPAAVRKKLENIGAIVPYSKDDYAKFCELATHITPDTTPQLFNEHDRPVAMPLYQPMGFLMVLNELSTAVGSVAGPTAYLAPLEKEIHDQLLSAAIDLIEGAGELNLGNYEEVLKQFKRAK